MIYTTATRFELCATVFLSQTGAAIVGAYVALKVLGYERTFMYLIGWLGRLYQYADAFILFFSKKFVSLQVKLTLGLPAGCRLLCWIRSLGLLSAYRHDKQEVCKDTINSTLVHSYFCQQICRLYALSFVSQYFGPLRVLVFVSSAAVLGLISAGLIVAEEDKPAGTGIRWLQGDIQNPQR